MTDQPLHTWRATPDPDWLLVGEVVGVFGIHGELKVRPATDFPERFLKTPTLYVGERHSAIAITNARVLIYAVREAGTGREVLVPAVAEMIKRVDVAAGVVVMDPIPGLFDDRFESADDRGTPEGEGG
jgi:ribosomal 30S subunit maturation factor RimM